MPISAESIKLTDAEKLGLLFNYHCTFNYFIPKVSYRSCPPQGNSSRRVFIVRDQILCKFLLYSNFEKPVLK
jgi:hypothetical protein